MAELELERRERGRKELAAEKDKEETERVEVGQKIVESIGKEEA